MPHMQPMAARLSAPWALLRSHVSAPRPRPAVRGARQSPRKQHPPQCTIAATYGQVCTDNGTERSQESWACRASELRGHCFLFYIDFSVRFWEDGSVNRPFQLSVISTVPGWSPVPGGEQVILPRRVGKRGRRTNRRPGDGGSPGRGSTGACGAGDRLHVQTERRQGWSDGRAQTPGPAARMRNPRRLPPRASTKAHPKDSTSTCPLQPADEPGEGTPAWGSLSHL